MSSDQTLKNLTDHYIQIDILAKLARTESPVRFTDLKDAGIENSLFMYHANKLLSRGLITKAEGEGFSLTAKGASWINFIGVNNTQPQVSPRLLVQFIITNDKGEVLLSRRIGSMGALLNEYMLPGGVYKYGRSLDENASTQLKKFISDDEAKLTLLTIAETVQVTGQGAMYHSIGYVYQVTHGGEVVSDDQDYESVWVSRDDLVSANTILSNSRFLPEFFNRMKSGVKPNELFQFN